MLRNTTWAALPQRAHTSSTQETGPPTWRLGAHLPPGLGDRTRMAGNVHIHNIHRHADSTGVVTQDHRATRTKEVGVLDPSGNCEGYGPTGAIGLTRAI